MTGIPASRALSRPCHDVVGGLDRFGRPVCRPDCPAIRVIHAGRFSASCAITLHPESRPPVQLRCELCALPATPGGAIGRLTVVTEKDEVVSEEMDVIRDLAAIATLATSLSPADLSHSLDRALEILCEATGTESAELFLAEPAGHDMVLTTYRGPFRSAFFQRVRFAPGEGYPGRVMADSRPAATNHLELDAGYLRSRVKAKGYHSYLCVPLVMAQRVIGAICLGSRDPDVSLSAAERLLTWASTPIATVLQAGLLLAREQVRAGATALAIGDGVGPDQSLESVLRHIVRQAEADGGALVVLDRHGSGVERRVVAGDVEHIGCPEAACDSTTCPALAGGHGMALFGARAGWPLACRHARGRGAMHYCLPMRIGDEPVGIVQLVYRGTAPAPPTRHLRMLLEIADQAADVARAYREREEARRDAESAIQHWLHAGQAPTATVDTGPGAEMPFLHFRCFGHFEIHREGALVAPEMFKRRKAQTLLKILLVNAGRPTPIETLIEWLWPEVDPRVGANRLYVVVHTLRALIEPAGASGGWSLVRTSGDQYLLDLDGCWLDLEQFRAAIATGRRAESAGDALRALTAYDAATRLYRGDLLEDNPFDEWCLMEREHLRETYVDALQRIAAISHDRGELDRAIDAWRRALRVDPLREDAQRRLIESLWLAGRRDEALRQYDQLRALLSDELGVAPMPETEDVIRRIRDGEPPRPIRITNSL